MESTTMNQRRVILVSLIAGVVFFVLGCIMAVILGDSPEGETLWLLAGFSAFVFLLSIPLLRYAFKHIPSPYYHWED